MKRGVVGASTPRQLCRLNGQRLAEPFGEAGESKSPVFLEAFAVRTLDRDRVVDVWDAHGIRYNIKDLRGLDNVSLANVAEHRPDRNFLPIGPDFEPLAKLLR